MTLPIHTIKRQGVRARIMACNACGLGTANRVPFDGPTSAADLVLVGEAPGANEDRASVPFVGRAGKLLDEMLEEAGTARHRCSVLNAVCCRPPSNRDPSWEEISACRPNLEAQLNLTEAKVGVTVGRIAASILKNNPKVAMTQIRSIPFLAHNKVWIPTYHPAYALRNPPARDKIVADLKIALSFVAFGEAIHNVEKIIGAEIIG